MNKPAFNSCGMAPGLDFLLPLTGSAGAVMPGLGPWMAPTLDPGEIDKRIGELRAVQFWLEQNTRLLAATIQALEVQRLTLAALKTMNPPLGVAAADEPADAVSAGVDPLQWWGLLTRQFAALAAQAVQNVAAPAPEEIKKTPQTAPAAPPAAPAARRRPKNPKSNHRKVE